MAGLVSRLTVRIADFAGAEDFDAGPALDVSIASSSTVEQLATLREDLRTCCPLGPRGFDALDATSERFGVELDVLGELLQLLLVTGLGPESRAKVFETIPPLTGIAPRDDIPSLPGAIEDLIATYGDLGHARAVSTAREMQAAVQGLADAVDTVIVEISTEDLGPQNANTILDALGEAGAELQALEGATQELGTCCQIAPGLLLAPVERLLAHLRVQVGALGDAAVLAMVPGERIPGEPLRDFVRSILDGATVDAGLAANAVRTRYDRLGSARGAQTVAKIEGWLPALADAVDAFIADATPARQEAVAAILDDIELSAIALAACCEDVPGLATPVLYHNARLRFHWEKLVSANEFVAIGPFFQRGDSNEDGMRDIADPVQILFLLFVGEVERPLCTKSADANDDGMVDVSDPLGILHHLFIDGAPLPEPFSDCGEDPTPDDIPSATPSTCDSGIQS